ncbi:MAG: hypothetical protein R3A51_17590, partial [Nannocystaceae bacterium]
MKLITPSPEAGLLGLRALYSIAAVDAPPTPEERSVLEAGQRLTHASCDLDALQTIEPEALAAAFPDDGQLRWQLTCALALMSMADEVPSREESALVDRFARALGVKSDVLDTLRKLAREQLNLARIDIYRRFWGRERIVEK